MQRLENRIAALEQAQPAQKITLILRRFVSPAHLGGEIDYLRDDNGLEWTRLPGESESDFTERAKSATAANQWGIKCLSGQTLRKHHADR